MFESQTSGAVSRMCWKRRGLEEASKRPRTWRQMTSANVTVIAEIASRCGRDASSTATGPVLRHIRRRRGPLTSISGRGPNRSISRRLKRSSGGEMAPTARAGSWGAQASSTQTAAAAAST